MAHASTWRADLSFAHRLQVTTQIKVSIQSAHPEVDSSIALNRARQAENAAYDMSNTAEEYDERCRKASDCERLASDKISRHGPAGGENGMWGVQPPGFDGKPHMAVGNYSDCVHYYSGLFSTVYVTRSEENKNQLLAIKLTTPSSEAPPHNSRREVRILSSLSHNNVIRLLNSQRVQNQTSFLLVFPFMPLSLAALLESKETVAKSILIDLASALAYIHSASLIHRDIKPANILLSSASGPALLCDFGIAWSPNDPSSEPSDAKITDVGTTCYRPPELLFGRRNYDSSLDMWAAGCVVAEVFMHNSHPESPADWTLFDAGELGSELALVKSIFETLGTPNDRTWPGTQDLPDWGKMTFAEFPARPWSQTLPDVSSDERLVVGDLVKYESTWRITAMQLLARLQSNGQTS